MDDRHLHTEQRTLLIATHNPGKLEEMARLLEPLGYNAIPAGTMGLTPPPEDADTFAGNAAIKARHASRETGHLALADDSGLCIPGLDNQPGLESARWAKLCGGWSQAQAEIYRTLVEQNAWGKGPEATMHCALAISHPNGKSHTVSGQVRGRLTWPPRGSGSSFDPIFIPDGYTISFAEMDAQAKAGIDARAQAFKALLQVGVLQEP